MRAFGGGGGFGGRSGGGGDHAPVELRFIDLLLIIIAILMFMAVLLSLVSANAPASEAKQPPVRKVAITTARAPDALAGEPYALTLAAEGGQGTYRWVQSGGTLPPGLSLSRDGVVSGSPELAGAKGSAKTTATVRVQDSAGTRRSGPCPGPCAGPRTRAPPSPVCG
ncbi:Ig domain-containing protein [Streptomyces sp. Ru72]|uniref:Ig domain-containing protein n=1 Tax=Streptomyces sp. Ru72 TaxID=2080747 RepID=UPI0011B0E2D7|nr:Ig domain-containing protein [Streptomyces sp. Ru72]